MPHRTQTGNRRNMSEREREQHRQEIAKAGGWYLFARQQRQAREQASATTTKEGLHNAQDTHEHQETAQEVS